LAIYLFMGLTSVILIGEKIFYFRFFFFFTFFGLIFHSLAGQNKARCDVMTIDCDDSANNPNVLS